MIQSPSTPAAYRRIFCLAPAVFIATTALMPTGASVAGRGGGNYPMEGTWNWLPYAGSGWYPRTTCAMCW